MYCIKIVYTKNGGHEGAATTFTALAKMDLNTEKYNCQEEYKSPSKARLLHQSGLYCYGWTFTDLLLWSNKTLVITPSLCYSVLQTEGNTLVWGLSSDVVFRRVFWFVLKDLGFLLFLIHWIQCALIVESILTVPNNHYWNVFSTDPQLSAYRFCKSRPADCTSLGKAFKIPV